MEKVFFALQAMRPPFVPYEYNIHVMVEECLLNAGLAYTHEAIIGKGCRIDYLVEDVGIEIKKGKQVPRVLLKQLERYAACEAIGSLVIISQRSVRLPGCVGGKALCQIVLPQLWGVALP